MKLCVEGGRQIIPRKDEFSPWLTSAATGLQTPTSIGSGLLQTCARSHAFRGAAAVCIRRPVLFDQFRHCNEQALALEEPDTLPRFCPNELGRAVAFDGLEPEYAQRRTRNLDSRR